MNNSNLPPILHHFRDMANYSYNHRCRQGGVPRFYAILPGERSIDSRLRNLASKNRNIPLSYGVKFISISRTV